MRVFRKRQLRLREADGDRLTIHGNPTNYQTMSDSAKDAQKIAKATNMPTDMVLNQSGSSVSKNTVIPNQGGDVNKVPSDAMDANRRGFDYRATIGPDGKVKGNDTNESRFSGDLIESAVMFSKKELRDFLKGL